MKKKEVLEYIGNLNCRLDYQAGLIRRLLEENEKHEDRIRRLNKKFTTISEYFQATCHPHINQIEELLYENEK
jgi:hypothetical protein